MRLRLLLLVFNTVLALGFSCVLVDPLWAELMIVYGGYPIIFVTFLIFVWSLARLFQGEVRSVRFSRNSVVFLVTIVGSSSLLLLHEPFDFKIVMDELVLLGISMKMHFEKIVAVAVRSNDYFGSFELIGGYLDKRPFFHPFLLSLVHTLTGYRPENAFVLNGALTFVLLVLVYSYGRKLVDASVGILAVLLIASVPLVGQNATGGHFEILNLVMIVAAMLLSCRYLEQPDERSLASLCYCGLLLAQTRYESVVFVLSIGAVVLIGWVRAGKPILSWPTVFAPLLLVGYPLHFRVTMSRPDFSQLAGKGLENAFSLEYVGYNLVRAVNYLFHMGQVLSNSIFLSLLGVIGLIIFLGFVCWRWREVWEKKTAHLVLFIFTVGVMLSFALTMGYHWGQYDDPIASRFSLSLALVFVFVCPVALRIVPGPYLLSVLVLFGYNIWFFIWDLEPLEVVTMGVRLILVFIIACALTLIWLLKGKNMVNFMIAATLVFIVFMTIPVLANHRYSQISTPATEVRMMREFFKENPRRDYFFTSRSALVASTHLVSSATIRKVRENPETIAEHILHRNYNAIYAFQLVDVHPDTGELHIVDKYDLGPRFVYETVIERRLVPLQLARIVRIVAVKSPEEGGENTLEADSESSQSAALE